MGRTLAALLLLVTATVATGSGGGRARAGRAAHERRCVPEAPEGKRLRLNLKPNTEVVDLVSWISAITCKHFIVPGTIPPGQDGDDRRAAANHRRRGLRPLSRRPRLGGLTVYPTGGVLRVIETRR